MVKLAFCILAVDAAGEVRHAIGENLAEIVIARAGGNVLAAGGVGDLFQHALISLRPMLLPFLLDVPNLAGIVADRECERPRSSHPALR